MTTTKCVLVCGSFFPREGGAERQMRSVLGRLGADGVRATVVTQVLEGQPRRATAPDTSIAIARVGSKFAFRRLPRLGQAVFLLAATLRAIRERPTAVVSLQFGSASLAGSLAARATRSRHVVRLTGGGTATHRSEPFARASNPLGRLLVHVICARDDLVVVAPAEHLLGDFRQAFPAIVVQAAVVPNGVDAPPEGNPAGDEMRRGVVWYARGGTEQSVAFFRSIAAACPDVPFYVLGQHVTHAELPNVRSLGWCDDVYSVLNGARVLLNTSRTEGSPNMALQALAVGCHVLGADNAGINELKHRFPGHVHTYPLDSEGTLVSTALSTLHTEALPGRASIPTPADVCAQWEQLISREED